MGRGAEGEREKVEGEGEREEGGGEKIEKSKIGNSKDTYHFYDFLNIDLYVYNANIFLSMA